MNSLNSRGEKMKGFLKAVGILLFLIALVVGGSYYYFENYVWDQFYGGGDGFEDPDAIAEQEALNRAIEQAQGYGKDRPFVFLIAGIDTNDVSSGRTDALMLAIVDTQTKKVNLLSLPRDLRVQIPNRSYDKINAAYAYGGVSLTKQTVSTYLNVPIDQYFVVNFNGFQQLIDTIGGLTIDVEKDLRFHDRIANQYFELSKGVQKLNGYEALNYARFRKDAEGDFGRMRRQQQVIREVVSQTASLSNVTKIGEIAAVLGDNMRTDYAFDNATKLAVSFAGVNQANIESIEAKSYPSMMNGVSYVVMDESEKLRIQAEIQRILKREP